MPHPVLDNPELRARTYPLSVEAYHALAYAGHIPEKVELIEGTIIRKMTILPLHAYLVGVLSALIEKGRRPGVFVRQGQPITTATSEPEPGIAIVEGGIADYLDSHPTTALFAVEIAIPSLGLDRDKAAIYASVGVGEYWIIDPTNRAVEVFTDPDLGARIYRGHRVAPADEPLPVPGCPGAVFTLAEHLPAGGSSA